MKPEDQVEIRLALLSGTLPDQPRVELLDEAVTENALAGDVRIWRYMTLDKFLALLTSRTLWFSRVDRLDDPFEGAAPNSDLRKRANAENAGQIRRVWSTFRSWHIASCWHEGSHESQAMWRLYAQAGNGVAIGTTVRALKESLERSPWQSRGSSADDRFTLPMLYIGRVHYVDFDLTDLEGDEPVARYFLKRRAFVHEKEIRVIAPLPELYSEAGIDSEMDPGCLGVRVAIDPNQLINDLIISPGAPSWFENAVGAVCRQYGLDVPVRSSRLDEDPKY